MEFTKFLRTPTMCEICSKLTIKTPERRHYLVLITLGALSRILLRQLFSFLHGHPK